MRKFLIRAGLVALLLLAIFQGVMMGRDIGPREEPNRPGPAAPAAGASEPANR